MRVSPSVYEHAASFLGLSPWEVSRDADLLFEAHAAAYRTYGHSPVVPVIDLYNLEPEAYGGVVERPDGRGSPTIARPVVGSARDLLALTPIDPARAGRVPMLLEVGRRLVAEFPEIQVRLPVGGPFSVACNLVGFDRLLRETAEEPESVGAALLHLVEGQVRLARSMHSAGFGIVFVELGACPPLLSPAMFRRLELPALGELVTRLRALVGGSFPCILSGNTAPVLETMLETGMDDLLCPSETDQEAFLETLRPRPDVRVRVNCDRTVIARGGWQEIRAEADRVMRLLRGRWNACVGTGGLPYETPPENVLRLVEHVSSRIA